MVGEVEVRGLGDGRTSCLRGTADGQESDTVSSDLSPAVEGVSENEFRKENSRCLSGQCSPEAGSVESSFGRTTVPVRTSRRV